MIALSQKTLLNLFEKSQ